MITLADTTVYNLDQLDLTHCVVGPDLVARVNGDVTLFRRDGHVVEFLGTFDGAACAFAALDRIDAPRR
jgi:hypothetical protein